ncbi:DUF5117 domain-containing protein [candidate division GN15 bacterium]|nr:DUF5117 domain-containing protein [candidate division GN15 bacterium]
MDHRSYRRLTCHVKHLLFGLVVVFAFALPTSGQTSRNDHSRAANQTDGAAGPKKKPKKKSDLKTYDELTKDMVAIEGLFTFYHDTTDNSMLMAVKPEQLDEVFLCGMTMSQGDGAVSEGSRMYGTIPFYLHRVGNELLFMEKNLRVRADSGSAMLGAVDASLSDGLIASTSVKSQPHDSTEAVLVDPKDFFIRDALNLNYYVGQKGKTGHRFDGRNSYFGEVKSFPENTEIDVHLHYETSKPMPATALQNPYSFYHVFHYSLSSIPESDYVPRYADDRVGYFQTIYQEYNRLDTETPYVYYIRRWHLEKQDPSADVSEPVEPIVFWVENTVPEEYRQAIVEGIEFWQAAFERAGFRNAIQAKIMPDTATWDPADVRYNTIRWLVAKNNPYTAIGPSRANPFTGQIYDADVGILADAVRNLYTIVERRVRPLTPEVFDGEEYDPFGEMDVFRDAQSCDHGHFLPDGTFCQVGNAAFEAAHGMAYINAVTNNPTLRNELSKEYVHQFLRFVTAHEVGHTLGFKHNFMASAIYDLDQINDPEFTDKHGMIGTVMDYPAANVAGPDREQGDFYGSVPGPYDYWVIAYGYTDFGADSPDDEVEELDDIASRAPEPGLAYASDEDTFGSSMKSIDPRTNVWDLGADPLDYFERMCGTSQEIWYNLISDFEEPGERYTKIRYVFGTAFGPYMRAAQTVPKYVGGIYHNRYHIGDAEGTRPFQVVPTAEQRRAMTFLAGRIFAADAFAMPTELVNKLQQETFSDFSGSIYTRPSIDYPLHQTILRVQEMALSRLYTPVLLQRLVNNEARYAEDDEKYTMYDMFTETRRAIWSEIVGPENVNSMRRQLQLSHLNRIINVYLSPAGKYPNDARTLAANDLRILKGAAQQAVQARNLDGMSRAHFREVVRQIDAAQTAAKEYSLK